MTGTITEDARDGEIVRLREGLGDLMGLLALSAAWTGREPPGIVRMLGEALCSVLRLDMVVVMLEDGADGIFARHGQGEDGADPLAEAAEWRRLLGADPRTWPSTASGDLFGKRVSIATLPLGLLNRHGIVAVATEREGFPGDTEKLLLNVARNQALLALQEARLRREESRQASELSAISVIEGVPGFIAVLAPDGQVERVNRQIEDYCGQPLEELRNWGSNGIVHPDDLANVAEVFGTSIATGVPYVIEQRLRRFDGTYRWFDNRGRPLRDESGQVLAWHVLLTDIDDRRRAEDAVRASERSLRQLTETIPQNLFGASATGSVDYLNPQMRDWFGRAEETIMAEEWVHLVHPDDRDGTVEAWFGAVAAGVPYRREVRFLHHSGEYHWCDNEARPLRDANGTIVAWHGVVNDIHDRKLAEQALKASEENLRLTIDTIPALAWSARADGTADFFNRHYLDYVGLGIDELRDWQWLRVIHPDDLAAISNAWKEFSAGGTGGEIEARVRRRDGTYRWFSFRAHPLRDDIGNVVKWYGVKVDIDDQKRATMMLADERHLLELIASGRRLLDIIAALCGAVERVIPGCVCEVHLLEGTGAVFEFAIAPSRPETLRDLVTGTPVASDLAPCGLAVESNAQVVAEDLRADERWQGSPVRAQLLESGFHSAWSTPIHSRDNKVFGALSLYHHARASPQSQDQDIIERAVHIASIAVERARAEDELKRREFLLSTAEHISETGSFSWDLVNDKLIWSEQMYRIWEVDEDARLGPPHLLPTVHPDDRPYVEEKIDRIFKGLDNPPNEERLVMPDGRLKWLNTSTLLFHYEDGRRECVGVAQDITRRKLAEESLDKVRSELAHVTRVLSLGELAASIAHEVNQPLSGIITNASTGLRMLDADPPDVEGALKTVTRTLRDGNRAAEVIHRLRGLFRRQDFSAEPLDLNEAAQDVMAICQHDLQRRGIYLRTEFDEALPPVLGDRIQLQQVVLNLVLNAADALASTEKGTRQIVVRTAKAPPDAARLSVSDTGPGIPADELGRIFDAFYTTKPEGMGIGLSVSKSIIDRHQGEISASTNDPKGMIVSFSIPRAPGKAEGGVTSL